MRNLIIATENRGKFEEIRSVLNGIIDTFFSLRDLPGTIQVNEDGQTYMANALKKARKIGDRFGMPTLADDSGLEVTALDGRPGIFSSRYGKNDEERIARILAELEGIPWEKRTASFKAYLVLYMPEQERHYVFYGELRGYMGTEKHGTQGFGYDPIFYEPEQMKYLAEMDLELKNTLSHRAKALFALKEFLNVEFFRNPTIQNL